MYRMDSSSVCTVYTWKSRVRWHIFSVCNQHPSYVLVLSSTHPSVLSVGCRPFSVNICVQIEIGKCTTVSSVFLTEMSFSWVDRVPSKSHPSGTPGICENCLKCEIHYEMRLFVRWWFYRDQRATNWDSWLFSPQQRSTKMKAIRWLS